MTTVTDLIGVERRILLDDLNLHMLFVDTADVAVRDAPADRRHLDITIRAHGGLSPAATAALLCRLLHHRRIPSVEIDRDRDHVSLQCQYLLATGLWSLTVRAPVP